MSDFFNIFEPRTLRTIAPSEQRTFGKIPWNRFVVPCQFGQSKRSQITNARLLHY
jgi:hypothetical protein